MFPSPLFLRHCEAGSWNVLGRSLSKVRIRSDQRRLKNRAWEKSPPRDPPLSSLCRLTYSTLVVDIIHISRLHTRHTRDLFFCRLCTYIAHTRAESKWMTESFIFYKSNHRQGQRLYSLVGVIKREMIYFLVHTDLAGQKSTEVIYIISLLWGLLDTIVSTRTLESKAANKMLRVWNKFS